MQEPNIKKLITGFLVLSVLTSSGALAISSILTSAADSETKIGDVLNVFSNSKPMDLKAGFPNENLTQELSGIIAERLLSANQAGPVLKGDDAYINLPADLDKSISSIIENASKSEDSTPSFGPDSSKIKIKSTYTERDIQKYLDDLNYTLEPLSGKEFENLESRMAESQDPSSSITGAGELLFSQIEKNIYDLQVPAPFLELHGDVLGIIMAQKNLFSSTLSSDPLRALVVHKKTREFLEKAGPEFLSDLQILSLTWPTIQKNSRKNIINVAHASSFDAAAGALIGKICAKYALSGGSPISGGAIPTTDYVTRVATCTAKGLQYLDYLEKILISALKKSLIQSLTKSVINWANGGGGDPTYITNWSRYLGNSYSYAAGNAINQIASGFCSGFRDKLAGELASLTGAKSLFGSTLSYGNSGCSLESLVDMNEFYGNFYLGGWDAYGLMALPSNNYYGSRYFMGELISASAKAAQESARAKAEAGKGNVGKETCENGKPPTNGICEDNSEPRVTIPGALTSDIIYKGLTSSIDQLIHANKLEDILVSYMSSAITKLITSSGNKGLIDENLYSSKAVTSEAACSSHKDPVEKQRCIDEIDSVGSGDGRSSRKESLMKQVQIILENTSSALNHVQTSLGLARNIIEILTEISKSCPAQTSAVAELEAISSDFAQLAAKADLLVSRISELESLLSEIESHDENDLAYFSKKEFEIRSAYGVDNGESEVNEEGGKISYFQNKLREVTTLLGQCVAQ